MKLFLTEALESTERLQSGYMSSERDDDLVTHGKSLLCEYELTPSKLIHISVNPSVANFSIGGRHRTAKQDTLLFPHIHRSCY